MHRRNCPSGGGSDAGAAGDALSDDPRDEGLPEVDQLIKCPQCGSGEHVDIAQAPGRGRGDWVGSCSACGVEWPFTDA